MNKKQWIDNETAVVFKNAALTQHLYDVASRPGLWQYPEFALPPSPWYTRLWWRVKAQLPRVHFGPCDHEHCDGY